MFNKFIHLYFVLGSRYFTGNEAKAVNPCSEYQLSQRVHKLLTGISDTWSESKRMIAYIPLGQDGFESVMRYNWNGFFPSLEASGQSYPFPTPPPNNVWNSRGVATFWNETNEDNSPRWGSTPQGRYDAHLHYTGETFNDFLATQAALVEEGMLCSTNIITAVQEHRDQDLDCTLDFYNSTVLPYVEGADVTHIDLLKGSRVSSNLSREIGY